ncbi:MAG: sigma-70 family RNA polymerase sigma factor [Acidobacteria bacterium]|nr:sigma-70 family RNA polymerase sigma factor [Acidobacteriota bacterium]
MNQDELAANIGTMTQILQQLDAGDPSAEEMVYRMQFGNLRRLASQVMGAIDAGVTLRNTDVLNEVFERLRAQQEMQFLDTEHFLSMARHRMREIVYAYARSRTSKPRTLAATRISVEDLLNDLRHNGLATADSEPQRVLELEQLLRQLAEKNARDCDLVDLYYFVGLSHVEIASRYGSTEEAIRKRLQFLRAWLNVHDAQRAV